MKKSILRIAIIAITISATSMSCANDNEKVADAKEEVIEAKEDLSNAQDNANESNAKAATLEEWKSFKIQSERKIEDNEAEIARLKNSLKKRGKASDAMYIESINDLEQKNKDLKDKVNEYETSQSDWATFQREFDNDMESLGKSIRGFTADNRE